MERIRLYRNELCHSSSAEMTTDEFNKIVLDLIRVKYSLIYTYTQNKRPMGHIAYLRNMSQALQNLLYKQVLSGCYIFPSGSGENAFSFFDDVYSSIKVLSPLGRGRGPSFNQS